MIRKMGMLCLMCLLLSGMGGCRKKVPLDRERFASLLLDMHRADENFGGGQGYPG